MFELTKCLSLKNEIKFQIIKNNVRFLETSGFSQFKYSLAEFLRLGAETGECGHDYECDPGRAWHCACHATSAQRHRMFPLFSHIVSEVPEDKSKLSGAPHIVPCWQRAPPYCVFTDLLIYMVIE
jgi:hypothetical protein